MSACRECASRGLLLSGLAGHIDRAVDRRVGDRARDLLGLRDEELARAACPGAPAEALRASRSQARHVALERNLEAAGCWSTCPHRPGFPASLSALGPAAPRALFGAGDRALLSAAEPERAATVVGARRASAYGREVAHDLARTLAASGIAVISGLALGVDSAAHEGALEGAGSTIAVLGAGADRPYPRSHRRLYERIRRAGLVISEQPPGSPTFRWMFPARNRVMAALAGLTIVVEAAERSGSLITAEMAIEGGRQVGAVPGPVTSWRSAGANKLLADGAAVIRDAQDVLDLLLGPGAVSVERGGAAIDALERAVLGAVEAGCTTADGVCDAENLAYTQALGALGRLERKGYLGTDATGTLIRRALTAPADGAGEGAGALPLRSSGGR